MFFFSESSSHDVDLDSLSLDSFCENTLPIEHHFDFVNVGSRLVLGEESDSDNLSLDNDDYDNHVNDYSIYVPCLDINNVTGFQAPIQFDFSSPINPSSLQVADEALLALVIENNLPQAMYNKILDWAHFAQYSNYTFSNAPLFCTTLH
jgi:hypothetical protein